MRKAFVNLHVLFRPNFYIYSMTETQTKILEEISSCMTENPVQRFAQVLFKLDNCNL